VVRCSFCSSLASETAAPLSLYDSLSEVRRHVGRGRLERVSDEELKGNGPPAMQHKVALGADCGFGVRPATVQPSEMELMEEEKRVIHEG
jgi:hypothetical protein